MNWILAILIIGAAVFIGTAIAFLVHKTFENMEKTSEYFEQIAKDLTRINELIQEGEQMVMSLESWRNK